MHVDVCDLADRSPELVAALAAGTRVTLLHDGEEIGDVVPRVAPTTRATAGDFDAELATRHADLQLADDLAELFAVSRKA